jgi:hypothetical protein
MLLNLITNCVISKLYLLFTTKKNTIVNYKRGRKAKIKFDFEHTGSFPWDIYKYYVVVAESVTDQKLQLPIY